MHIRTTTTSQPRFSGVHPGEAPYRDENKLTFYYSSPGRQIGAYHTSGQDTVEFRDLHRLYRLMEAQDMAEGTGIDPELEQAYQEKCAALAAKEPTNRLYAAIKNKDANSVWQLVKDPKVLFEAEEVCSEMGDEVEIVPYEDTHKGPLPEYLLGNDHRFNVIKGLTGGVKEAKRLIKEVLAKEFTQQLNAEEPDPKVEERVEHRFHLIPKGWTKKRDDRDIRSSAEKMADTAIQEYSR